MKPLYLSIVGFVFIFSGALVFNRLTASTAPPNVLASQTQLPVVKHEFPSIPLRIDSGSEPQITAQAVFAIDVDSQTVFFEKNPDSQYYPASTTKILTALVVLDSYRLDRIVTVKKPEVAGQKMHLTEGEKISVNDLLYGLLVYSANDAAEVLAENHPQGREVFIDDMNRKAQSLKMGNSHFINPSGLDNYDQLTSARDLTKAALVAMKNPIFSEIVGTVDTTVTSIDGETVHYLKNINELLGSVEGVKGVKTGWTENALENLVTFIERDGHKVIITVLSSRDRFGDTKELISWIFGNYKWQPVM